MRSALKKLSLVFTAGAVGGFAKTLLQWFLGYNGFLSLFDAKGLGLEFSREIFYNGMVWGGIWGILFILPFLEDSTVIRGIVYSLAPAAVELFIIFPFIDKVGFMGVEGIGRQVPFFVVFFYIVWGIVASTWWWAVDFERIKPKTWHPPGQPR
jgi:hypothetical protein